MIIDICLGLLEKGHLSTDEVMNLIKPLKNDREQQVKDRAYRIIDSLQK